MEAPVPLSHPSGGQYGFGLLLNTTPAVIDIDSPDCVKWRETLPIQEEYAGRNIPVGHVVTFFSFNKVARVP